jgi:hypothetical protein
MTRPRFLIRIAALVTAAGMAIVAGAAGAAGAADLDSSHQFLSTTRYWVIWTEVTAIRTWLNLVRR